jgi:cytochrome c
VLAVAVAALAVVAACGPPDVAQEPAATAPQQDAALPLVQTSVTPFDAATRPYELKGPLVPASVTMVSAWDIPDDPLTDPLLDGTPQGEQVRWGYRLFMSTPAETPRLTPSGMSCGNCHLNGGQRELALPLVGSGGMFPEYNRRAARDFTLEDRIVGCIRETCRRNRQGEGPAVAALH